MIGNPKVIAQLQRAVAGEALAEHQYICDAEWLDRIGLLDLAAHVHGEANEEKAHLTRYSRRLIFLESDPIIAPLSTKGQTSVTAMLQNQLRLEMEAVQLYTESCSICLAESDFVSFEIFKTTLADENDHVRFLEGQLYLINQMGEANYLQSYVKLPEVH